MRENDQRRKLALQKSVQLLSADCWPSRTQAFGSTGVPESAQFDFYGKMFQQLYLNHFLPSSTSGKLFCSRRVSCRPAVTGRRRLAHAVANVEGLVEI